MFPQDKVTEKEHPLDEINSQLFNDPDWKRREQMARTITQRRILISTGLTIPFIVPLIFALLTFGS